MIESSYRQGFLLCATPREQNCATSIYCSISTKWLLISINDILLLDKYKPAGLGEFWCDMIQHVLAITGVHGKSRLFACNHSVMSQHEIRFRCGNNQYVYILFFFINTLVIENLINFWRRPKKLFGLKTQTKRLSMSTL